MQGPPAQLTDIDKQLGSPAHNNSDIDEDDSLDSEDENSSKTQVCFSSSSISLDNRSHDKHDEKSMKALQLESSSKGKVKGSMLEEYFRAGASFGALFMLFMLFLLTQIMASAADYWVSYWTLQEELRAFRPKTRNLPSQTNNHSYIEMESRQDAGRLIGSSYNGSATETDLHNILSTKSCMIAHGSIILGLFIFCIIRYAVMSSSLLH